MGYYKDLREHLAALEKAGKLFRIKREINKDTELMPLVRWQFRGLPEEERRAFLFEKVTDAKGRKYDIPVTVGALAASKEIYAMGMQCEPDQIMKKWTDAQLHPIKPVLVDKAPVHEEVHMGAELEREGGGLDEFPIPISTPGFDNAPYTTASHFVTKDPDTGSINVGNYRGMIKSRTRTGICAHPSQHIDIHWKKCRAKKIPLEAALVIGAPTNVAYTAVTKIPYGKEYEVAGGIAGEPVELVKCKTVDLEVPAWSEIVIEGKIPTDYLEREGPFGEFPGYMAIKVDNVYFDVTCITHRKNPILTAITSQFPPSESSKMKLLSGESIWYKFLHYDCNLPSVTDVGFLEEGGSGRHYIVIQMKKTNNAQPWQALNATVALTPSTGKIIVAVDDDIDPRDADAVNWALCFRMQPHLDSRITMGRGASLDPSIAPPGDETREGSTFYPLPNGGSALLIDATRKWDYPPVALPKKEFMDRARQIWEEEGLPRLRPKQPWFGYPLGHWSAEDAEEAELALKGEHYKTGEKLSRQRKKI